MCKLVKVNRYRLQRRGKERCRLDDRAETISMLRLLNEIRRVEEMFGWGGGVTFW